MTDVAPLISALPGGAVTTFGLQVQFSGTGGLPVPINAHRVDEVVHDDALTCYGRFPETNYVKVDPMKSYKVGIWIKSTGRDMKNYFGFRIFTEAQVLISDDTDWVNPYFKDSRSDANIWKCVVIGAAASPPPLRCQSRPAKHVSDLCLAGWLQQPDGVVPLYFLLLLLLLLLLSLFLGGVPACFSYHTGILRPADTANTNTQHGSGETTSAFDWKMSANTSYVILRFGACYGDGDGQDTSWFAYPSMRQVFPREDNVEDVQPKDPTQSTNLINFADFSDRRSWIQGNFDVRPATSTSFFPFHVHVPSHEFLTSSPPLTRTRRVVGTTCADAGRMLIGACNPLSCPPSRLQLERTPWNAGRTTVAVRCKAQAKRLARRAR